MENNKMLENEKNLPPFLSSGDPGSFAMRTITWRKPKIADQVIEANELPADARQRVLALKEEIASGTITDPFKASGLPEAELTKLFAPEERKAWQHTIDDCQGRLWVGIPWYVAESLFYLRLLFATGYFDPYSTWFHRDPFEPMKQRELHGPDGGREVIRKLASDLRRAASNCEAMAILLYSSLWGNRVDLSNFDIAEKERGNVLLSGSESMLMDHTQQVTDLLLGCHQVDILMDNCGAELVCDLALTDFLLHLANTRVVVLHLKRMPFYVSDTMVKDVRVTIGVLAADSDPSVTGIGRRLEEALSSGRLVLRDHYFWNGPLHFVELPADLQWELGRSNLVLIKGDAYYRRLISDRHWEPWRSMEDLTRYFPAPFAAFRTMKSEIVVDTPKDRLEELFRTDPEWMINGKRGIVRLCGGLQARNYG
jgi:hypothetical protein